MQLTDGYYSAYKGSAMTVADPRGFEPPFSGSEGRRLDPDWATGPSKISGKAIKRILKILKTVRIVLVNAV